MKKVLIFISASCLMILLSACSSSRLLPYKYEDVVSATAEKFNVNEWTEFYTKKSAAKENPGKKVVFTHYHWTYNEYKIMCEVQVENERGYADVYVFVRDWDNWLSPFIHYPSHARKVLTLIEKRMQTGTWQGPMPWEKEDVLK